MSVATTAVDMQKVHRHLAAECFNSTWALLSDANRSAERTQQMIHTAHASRWHWSQVSGHTSKNLAIGDWLLARVYAIAGRPEEAMHYAKPALQLAIDHRLGPFFVAYGHEAMARAAAAAGDTVTCDHHARQMDAAVADITDSEERDMLASDLEAFPLASHRE